MHPCPQSTVDIAHVTFSGSLLFTKFLFLRLAAGSMSAADTGGLLAICPATGASEGAYNTSRQDCSCRLGIDW